MKGLIRDNFPRWANNTTRTGMVRVFQFMWLSNVVVSLQEPLNSADDVSDDDTTDLFDTDNVVVCQYDKVSGGSVSEKSKNLF